MTSEAKKENGRKPRIGETTKRIGGNALREVSTAIDDITSLFEYGVFIVTAIAGTNLGIIPNVPFIKDNVAFTALANFVAVAAGFGLTRFVQKKGRRA